MSSVVIGLDVSTACTGLAVLNPYVEADDKGTNIIVLDRVEFKGCDTLWQKADVIEQELVKLHAKMCSERGDEVRFFVFVEAALMGFRPGMSSAATISTLQKFNGITSYIARNVFDIDPEFIASVHARSVCGIKVQRTSKVGKSQKQQVFEHMQVHDLSHVKWPTKKSGKPKDWAYDATDAYVIAKAGVLTLNTHKDV